MVVQAPSLFTKMWMLLSKLQNQHPPHLGTLGPLLVKWVYSSNHTERLCHVYNWSKPGTNQLFTMKLVETQTFLTSIHFLVLPNYFWQISPSRFDIVAWYQPSAQISHLDLIFKREIRFDLNLAFATNNSIWTRYVLLQSSYFEFATNVVLFLFWIVTNIKFQLDLVKLVLGKAKSEWPVAPGNTNIWWWWGCSIEMRWGWL